MQLKKLQHLLPWTIHRIRILTGIWHLETRWYMKRFSKSIYISDVSISLATMQGRALGLDRTVRSLITQSAKYENILIWVTENEYEEFSTNFEKYQKWRVFVRKSPVNLGSYNKYHHIAIENPKTSIVCADDDILYPSNWLESLLSEAKNWPGYVIGTRGVTVGTNNTGQVLPYKSFKRAEFGLSSKSLVLNTGAGTYYPANIFPSPALHNRKFLEIAPRADDLWMFALEVIYDIPKRISSLEIREIIPSTLKQDFNLWKMNVSEFGNDKQLAAILGEYPEIEEKLRELKKYQLLFLTEDSKYSSILLREFLEEFELDIDVEVLRSPNNERNLSSIAEAISAIERRILNVRRNKAEAKLKRKPLSESNPTQILVVHKHYFESLSRAEKLNRNFIVTTTSNLFSDHLDRNSAWSTLKRKPFTHVEVLYFQSDSLLSVERAKLETRFLLSENQQRAKLVTKHMISNIMKSIPNKEFKNDHGILSHDAENAQFLALIKYVVRNVVKKLISLKKVDQGKNWQVEISRVDETCNINRSWNINPEDFELTADPFLFQFNEDLFCFVEQVMAPGSKGEISVYKLIDEEWKRLGVCLSEEFHLSFPYIFTFDSDIYMLPEASRSREIALYKAVDFPMAWEKSYTLITSISAADSVMFESDRKWWLLTNVDELGLGDHNSELHIWFADSPISGNWQPHPLNPIIIDSSTARNGGLIKLRDKIYRVAQNSNSGIYGRSFSLFEIIEISENTYVECKIEHNLNKPGSKSSHHFSMIGDYMARDFIMGGGK